MSTVLLQLSMCIIAVIQMTSSQPTYDVFQQCNDVISCARTEQTMCQLVTAVSQLQSGVSRVQETDAQLVVANSQMLTAVSELQKNNNSELVTAVSQLQSGVSQLQETNSQLVMAVSRLQNASTQLMASVAQLEAANSQLQRDVAELKAGKQQQRVKGMIQSFCLYTVGLACIFGDVQDHPRTNFRQLGPYKM